MKLKAEINILLRSNSRLKADKAADTAHMEALASQLSGLRQQLGEAAAVADKLRGELTERDGVIGDNSASLQGLRRRVQELETHKFVLGYKVSGCMQPTKFEDNFCTDHTVCHRRLAVQLGQHCMHVPPSANLCISHTFVTWSLTWIPAG